MEILKNKRVDLNSNAYMIFDNSSNKEKVSLYLKYNDKYHEFELDHDGIGYMIAYTIEELYNLDTGSVIKGFGYPIKLRIQLNGKNYIRIELPKEKSINILLNLLDTIDIFTHGSLDEYLDTYYRATMLRNMIPDNCLRRKIDLLRQNLNNKEDK